jgi:hypothetical protein
MAKALVLGAIGDYVLRVRHPCRLPCPPRCRPSRSLVMALDVIQVKRVYNPGMTVFRYGREHYEDGEYVRYMEAVPGDGRDPVVRIVEDLGTIEIPCGKVDCRSNCLEYLVRSAHKREDYSLAECKLSPLVSII